MAVHSGVRRASRDDRSSTLVLFRLGEADYALPLDRVVEVLRMVAITPVPESPRAVAGVIDLRGRVIPVLDLRRRLGMPDRAYDLRTPILVAEDERRVVGLVADEVVQMLPVPAEAIDGPETLGRPAAAVEAVARPGGRLVLVLDLAAVCDVLDEVVIPDLGHRQG